VITQYISNNHISTFTVFRRENTLAKGKITQKKTSNDLQLNTQFKDLATQTPLKTPVISRRE
jgi:hypothetical protein